MLFDYQLFHFEGATIRSETRVCVCVFVFVCACVFMFVCVCQVYLLMSDLIFGYR